jgi:tyrosinase
MSRYTLTDVEKKAYIDAELCLMSKPADLGLRGARTKYDEFQSVHTLQAEIAHWVVCSYGCL